MTYKKQYNAIDLLKFVMALLVIMIHVKPNTHSDVLMMVFNPMMAVAVPVFFIISSMLIFSKLNGGGYSDLIKYCKRIGLLYFCWFVIDFWFIWTNKPYVHDGLGGVLELLKDVIFATTFPGSWYLSASVMGVVLVYLINKFLHPVVTFVLTYLLACYIWRINIMPEQLQGVYDWYAIHFREEVNLSFPAQMVWISVGQLLSMIMTKLDDQKTWLLPVSVTTFIISFAISLFVSVAEIKILMALSIVIACLLIDLPSAPIYKRLRNYSILMFFFHFSIAGKMSYFTRYVGDSLLTNWIYYIMVVVISVIFAEAVIRFEKTKYFSFLKYTH